MSKQYAFDISYISYIHLFPFIFAPEKFIIFLLLMAEVLFDSLRSIDIVKRRIGKKEKNYLMRHLMRN